jgi:glutamate synthase domain-containing protein 1
VPYSHAFPPPQGLYDPSHEHDACGVAFVATLTGEASHDIVVKALTALRNLDHRGAAGAEPNSGDGAGILMQVPDGFLREVAREAGFELPEQRCYAVGTAFLPGDEDEVAKTRRRIEEIAGEEGLAVLGWREVPVNPAIAGAAEILGINAMYVANEGKFVAFVAPEASEDAVAALRSVPGCEQAAEIGEVKTDPPAMVLVDTGFGRQVMDLLVGDPLPRIC